MQVDKELLKQIESIKTFTLANAQLLKSILLEMQKQTKLMEKKWQA